MKQNSITMEELLEKFRVKHAKYLETELKIQDKVKFKTTSLSIDGIYQPYAKSKHRIDGNTGIKKDTIGTIVECEENHYWVKYINSTGHDMCLAFHKEVLIKIKE